ncbi:CHAT domain-containing tetratricopeptide repeat protein [Pyxidicoccus sp. MSG2]|uniref:CHAT domain-containing tetratricopeptide repeat protein n=1 Tax=Pyxidicoccus sp. MSG2 TaxID=2996790 RepID=UPI00226F7E5B|nr:CHAT domain-containing protein [Pyxidicoccus sp. MSG2]MCY1023894.1 CHAT domain-containing protein [Pyxidicoccus sp. MSG2]
MLPPPRHAFRSLLILAFVAGLGMARPALSARDAGVVVPAAVAECVVRFEARPRERESALCFYQSAQGPAGRDAARQELKALEARHPEQPWLPLALGHVELLSGPSPAEEAYRRAVQGFRRLQDAEGEVIAAINLRNVLVTQGRTEEVREWTRRIGEVARASGSAELNARALIVEANERFDVEHDAGGSFRLLKRAEALAFPDGSAGLKKQCLTSLATVSTRLGRLDEAVEFYHRLAELARSTREGPEEARVRVALANLALRRNERQPEPGGRERVLALAREALAAAEQAGSKSLEMMSLRLVVDMLGGSPEEQREGEQYLRRCLALADELAMPDQRIACLWTRAERRSSVDPAAADQDSDAALRLAFELGNPHTLALALRGRATVALHTQPLPEALRHAERALDGAEALRELQRNASSQAEVFANWARDYHRLAGWTLEAGGATGRPPQVAPREALERAFRVSERLRARSLLDALAASWALSDAFDEPGRRAGRAEVQRKLAAVQRRLLEPGLAAGPRDAALRELQELERSEEELRPAPRHGAVGFPSLATIERGLAPDEALFAFLVGDDQDVYGNPAGGAWLLAVTREGTRAHRLPERARLTSAVALFTGLIERRDGSEAGAAAALHTQLLAPALAGLPSGVRRLLLVPDGPLHDLPFAALRERPDGPPLVARYELALVPSASLLHYWRQQRPLAPGGEALVLADPDRGGDARVARATASERSGVFEEAARLGALPEARWEGHAVEQALQETTVAPRLLVGAEASERALKSADLASVRVLHLAAHAVVDAEAPERSALVLAPGAEEEDGILQPREIAELHLGGALVVLSSCRSASGAVLPGEGVLSLARAFFEAGSRAVVASLWPLRDDETAELVARFYRHLAHGLSASAALRAAQLEALEDGQPTSAWAGLVVLGDAALVAVEPRKPEGTRATSLLLAGAGAAVLCLLTTVRVWRRRRSLPKP